MLLFAAVFSLAITLCIYAVVRYVQADQRPIILTFIVLMTAVSSWELVNFLVDAVRAEQLKLLGKNIVNSMISPLFVYGTFSFALVYTDNERWVGWVAVICAVQIVVTSVAVFLAPELLYESQGVITQGPFTVAGVTFGPFVTLDRTLKPAFLLVWLHAQLVGIVSGVILIQYIRQTPRIFIPAQVGAVLVGIGAPLIASFLLVGDIVSPAWNPTDLAFVVTAVSFAMAVFRYRLFRLVPMGSQRLAGIADDPVILLEDDWVIGSNSAARALFDVESDQQEVAVETVFGSLAEQVMQSDETDATDTGTFVSRDTDDRYFDIRDTRVQPSAGTDSERLVVLRDITAVIESKQKIQQQDDRLEEFADIVAQDLRE